MGGRGDEAGDGRRRGEERKITRAFISKNIGDIEGKSGWNMNDRGHLVWLGDQNPDSSHRGEQAASWGAARSYVSHPFHKIEPEQTRDPAVDK